MSRNLKSLRFEGLRVALGKLPVKNAIFDAEIVCLDQKGVSQFNWLLSERRSNQAILYAFDASDRAESVSDKQDQRDPARSVSEARVVGSGWVSPMVQINPAAADYTL